MNFRTFGPTVAKRVCLNGDDFVAVKWDGLGVEVCDRSGRARMQAHISFEEPVGPQLHVNVFPVMFEANAHNSRVQSLAQEMLDFTNAALFAARGLNVKTWE